MFVGNPDQFKTIIKVTRDGLALTSLHRELTREGRWQGSSAPNPLGFLQISHPADAKTSQGRGWGGSRAVGSIAPLGCRQWD